MRAVARPDAHCDRNERMTSDKGRVAVSVPFSAENNKAILRASAIMEGTKALTDAATKGTNGAKAGRNLPRNGHNCGSITSKLSHESN